MFARNDEQVHGSLRIYVTKSYAAIVLINRVGWNLTRDDATKEAVHSSKEPVTSHESLKSD